MEFCIFFLKKLEDRVKQE